MSGMQDEQLRLFLYFAIVQEWVIVDVPASLSFALLLQRLEKPLNERYRGRYVLGEEVRIFTYDKKEPCDITVSFTLAHIVSGMSFIIY